MKIIGIREKGNRLLAFALLVALTGISSVAGATYSLPAARSVAWQGNAGVLGDIPSRATVYATLNPSGGDDTSAIQTAINNCPTGQVVKLNAGIFTVSNSITVKSGITLRGAGMGVTTIRGASGMSGGYVVGFYNSSASVGTSIGISSGLTKGSSSITTSSAHGWSVGDIILIDQLNNPQADPPVNNVGSDGTCTWCGRTNGTRSLGQVAKIVAVPTSTTATLEIPLYWNYDASMTPQGTKFTGITQNAGIEDLTVDNSLSGSANQADDNGTILVRATANCWLLRVEGIGSYESMVRFYSGYRDTIRSCRFHEGIPATPINGTQYSPSRAYGIYMNRYASANLIENNQLYHLRLPILMSGAISGNVIAYNSITDQYSDSGASTFQLAAITTHGSHPIMNLIEGNITEGRLRADDVWGSSSHNTYFRNREFLDPSRNSGTWDVDLHSNQQYYNLIGNVLGTLGVQNTYELNNVTLNSQVAIYRFGYTSDGDTDPTGNDPQVYATVLRHGNWDSVHNGVVWNGTDDRVLPASLYLTSIPAWWGNIPWPAIGWDVLPMYPAVPAAGAGTPWATIAPPLLSPLK